MARIKESKIVEVEWVDASVGGGWRTRKEHEAEIKELVNRSVGYVFRANRKEVVLMQSIAADDRERFADYTQIPRPFIRSITVVRAGKVL